jgi:hypothetical protein
MPPVKHLVSYCYSCWHETWPVKGTEELLEVTEAQVVCGEFHVLERTELGDVTLMDETLAKARKL